MNTEHKDFENVDQMEKTEAINSADVTSLMNNIEKLQRELAEEKLKAEQANELALRMKAEAENTRKRATRDVEQAHKYGMEKFIKELLTVMDTFELGLQAVSSLTDQASIDFAQAMKMTHKMLLDNMANFGVAQINPQGQLFDPKTHEALSLQHTNEYAPNTVVAVLQPGFVLYERVLRPARVVVAKPVE